MILVAQLVREAKKQPEKQRELKLREKEAARSSQAVESVASKMLECSIPIENAAKVQMEVKRLHHVDLSVPKVGSVLKSELGLGYRVAKKVPIQVNSERCLVLRQQHALKMLELLGGNDRIINIDESWLNESNFTRKIWCPGRAAATMT